MVIDLHHVSLLRYPDPHSLERAGESRDQPSISDLQVRILLQLRELPQNPQVEEHGRLWEGAILQP